MLLVSVFRSSPVREYSVFFLKDYYRAKAKLHPKLVVPADKRGGVDFPKLQAAGQSVYIYNYGRGMLNQISVD
jgi:hypothetical protein